MGMNDTQKDFIINKVIKKFLNVNKTLKLGDYKILGYDEYLQRFELDGTNYVLFFADYIGDDDKEWVIQHLQAEGLNLKEFIYLLDDKNTYIFRPSDKKVPYKYEHVFDDSYICVRM
jgi:hypothetical protein